MDKTKRLSSPTVPVLLLFAFAPFLAQAQSQRTFDTNLPVADFVFKHGTWEHDHGKLSGPTETVPVPMLDIYSPSGILIYHGAKKDAGRAAQILDSLPALPSPAPAPDAQMSLGEILQMTPDLAKSKDTILSSHHFVVVSISAQAKGIQKTDPFNVQNQAVASIPKRPGVDVDVVHINLVFPKN